MPPIVRVELPGWRAPALRGWGAGEAASGEHNRDVDFGAVELSFVHFCDGLFRVVYFFVKNISDSAVCVDYGRFSDAKAATD